MGNSLGPSAHPKVGYCNPPQHTRFKKGQSGNPRGRPKGSQNLATVLERILRETVTISEISKSKNITKKEYVVQQLINKSSEGDLRALQLLLALVRSAEAQAPQEDCNTTLPESDRKVLQRILQRVQDTAISKEKDDHESHKQ